MRQDDTHCIPNRRDWRGDVLREGQWYAVAFLDSACAEFTERAGCVCGGDNLIRMILNSGARTACVQPFILAR